MKLYYSPGACSFSPHIVAEEAEIKLDLVKVNLKTKQTDDGRDFAKINPKGYVPALELDDGQLLTEGPAIVQYLADLKPEKGLVPKCGTFERAKLQEWLNFISTEIHKGFGPLFYPTSSEQEKEAAKAKLTKRFELIEEQLKKTAFITGDQFSVADAYFFTVLQWCAFLKFDISSFKAIQQYNAKVATRDSVKKALMAEKA